MHPIRRAAALATALVSAASVLLITAAPADAAGGRRSSDACTHNWGSGPQVCIGIKGHDNSADKVTITWTNPDGNMQESTAILHEGDDQREVHIRQVGHRSGGKIVAEWDDVQLAWGKVCGSFVNTSGVWACQDVYAGGAWSS